MYIDVVYLLRHLLDQVGLEEVEILSMLAHTPFEADPSHPLALYDSQAALMEIHYFLQAGNGYPGDSGAQWPSVPAARTPLHHVYLVADGVRGCDAPTPIDTITDYVWSDATGGAELLCAAREWAVAEDSSVVPPSLRSVGVVSLADLRLAQQKPLAPVVVRELLVRWLGLPSKARQAAAPLADRLTRRTGITMEAIVQEVNDNVWTSSRRASFEEAIAGLGTDEASAAMQSMVESMMGQAEFQRIPTTAIYHVQRELSVVLNDRRADLTTVIECLRTVQSRMANFGTGHQDATGSDQQNAQGDQHMVASPEPSPARLIAAHYLRQISASLNTLQKRLEEFATVLAIAIVEASKSQTKQKNPWDALPDAVRSQFDSVELALHETTANCYLVRSLSFRGSEIHANEMVSELTEAVEPILSGLFDENQDAFLSQNPPSDSDLTDSDSNPSMTSFDSSGFNSETVTQQFQSLRNRRNLDEPLSVEDAIVAVKPALLEFGGLQRLILVVGNEQERSRLEPQVRAFHKGSLTVAIVPGSTAKLIHEAQQIELSHILSRLTVLNGGNSKVTSRLTSRTDISW